MVITKKPDWIRVKGVDWKVLEKMKSLTDKYNLHTVCEGATCPNMGECFSCGTSTFMILGDICTRNCAFCSVTSAKAMALSNDEGVDQAIIRDGPAFSQAGDDPVGDKDRELFWGTEVL